MRWELELVLGGACALVLATGCSDMTGAGGGSVRASLTVSPAPLAANISRLDTVQITFPMAVDSASCAQRFLMHRGDSTGPVVMGRMSFTDGYRHMTFVPDSIMLAHQAYFVHVRDSMMTYGGTSGGMGGGMGGMGGGMSGTRQMMMMVPPAGGMRMGDGAGWSFTTGS